MKKKRYVCGKNFSFNFYIFFKEKKLYQYLTTNVKEKFCNIPVLYYLKYKIIKKLCGQIFETPRDPPTLYASLTHKYHLTLSLSWPVNKGPLHLFSFSFSHKYKHSSFTLSSAPTNVPPSLPSPPSFFSDKVTRKSLGTSKHLHPFYLW